MFVFYVVIYQRHSVSHDTPDVMLMQVSVKNQIILASTTGIEALRIIGTMIEKYFMVVILTIKKHTKRQFCHCNAIVCGYKFI